MKESDELEGFPPLCQNSCHLKDLERRFDALEKRYDEQFIVVFDSIRALMEPPDKSRKPIGFEVKDGKAVYGKKKCYVLSSAI